MTCAVQKWFTKVENVLQHSCSNSSEIQSMWYNLYIPQRGDATKKKNRDIKVRNHVQVTSTQSDLYWDFTQTWDSWDKTPGILLVTCTVTVPFYITHLILLGELSVVIGEEGARSKVKHTKHMSQLSSTFTTHSSSIQIKHRPNC